MKPEDTVHQIIVPRPISQCCPPPQLQPSSNSASPVPMKCSNILLQITSSLSPIPSPLKSFTLESLPNLTNPSFCFLNVSFTKGPANRYPTPTLGFSLILLSHQRNCTRFMNLSPGRTNTHSAMLSQLIHHTQIHPQCVPS